MMMAIMVMMAIVISLELMELDGDGEEGGI